MSDAKQMFPHGICTITPPALNITPEQTSKILAECARGRKLSQAELWMPQNMRGYEFGVPYLVRHELHGCKCNDKEQMNRQKGVTTHLIKSMGSNLLEGKSVINVSLPVRIFEPRSFLQRIADVWAFAPMYLPLAARSRDPVERMKWTITFLVAGMHRGTIQLKPFNPILGETMQGSFPDGTRMFCEQVSHHPPITAFQMVDPQGLWEYEGFHECNASFRPNGLVGYQTGPNRMHFADGTVITFNMPKCKVSGILFGERVVSYTGPLIFHDAKNNLKAELELNPDGLSGLKSWISSAKTPADTIRGTIQQNDKVMSTFEGSWLWDLSFDGKIYWALGQYQPFDPVWPSDEQVLPSDSRFRADLIYLARGDEETSQREKERLEEEQRFFRKLRSKHSKQKEVQLVKSSSKGLLSSLGSFFSKSKSKGSINHNDPSHDDATDFRSASDVPPSLPRARTLETPHRVLDNDSPEPSPQLRPCELHVDFESGCPGCSGKNSLLSTQSDDRAPVAARVVSDDLVLDHSKKPSGPRFL